MRSERSGSGDGACRTWTTSAGQKDSIKYTIWAGWQVCYSRPVMQSAELLADLTPEQQKAVRHVDGPLLIIAGAGSGKTRVITRRVAHLMSQGAAPWSIL